MQKKEFLKKKKKKQCHRNVLTAPRQTLTFFRFLVLVSEVVMGVCGRECGGKMFIVALFPVTLQVAPDQDRRQNASAVNVNNFSISKRAISIRANKTAAK